MSFYINLNADGTEQSREQRKQGRTRTGYERRDDGNWYMGGPTVTAKTPVATIAVERPQIVSQRGSATILTPAGRCPIKLTGTDRETVSAWAANVRSHNPQLAREAVEYHAREFYPIYSDDYAAVISNLRC